MADVFVSYATEDRERVRPIVETIENAGFSVWWDRRIGLGASFDREIERELDSARCVVVVWSTRSVDSDWVRNEAQEGLQRGVLVPLLIDDVRPPLAFRRAQTAALSEKPTREELHLVLAAIESTNRPGQADESPASAEPDNEAPDARSAGTLAAKRKWAALAAGMVLVFAAIALGTYLELWRPSAEQHEPINVAVLPFRNTSGDPAQNYIGDAMAEEIWNRLSADGTLNLIAMTSARAAVTAGMDARRMAESLGVTYLVEGSVAQAGEQARVNARVIDATDGTNLWNERYDRRMASTAAVFGLYDEISAGVASAFGILLAESSPDSTGVQVDITAFNLIEQAFYNYRAGLVDQVKPLIDQALAVDPNYARAHSMKGWWVRNKVDSREIVPAWRGYRQARDHIERAIELDPEYAPAHVQLAGMTMRMDLDYPRAMATLQRAERMGAPLNMLAGDKTRLLRLAGHLEEALAILERAALQDPLFIPMRVEAVPILDELGRYEEAVALLIELEELAPQAWPWERVKVVHAVRNNDFEAARRLIDAMEDPDPEWVNAATAAMEARQGEPQRWKAFLEGLAHAPNPHPLTLANGYLIVPDFGRHLDWVDVAFDERFLLDDLIAIIRRTPDYWKRLDAWASADADAQQSRQARVADHRARIDEVEAKMKL